MLITQFDGPGVFQSWALPTIRHQELNGWSAVSRVKEPWFAEADSPPTSMLKWYRSEDGYRRSTQGGSSITTPASQMTSQDFAVWLKFAE
jgi:hypothetical protein